MEEASMRIRRNAAAKRRLPRRSASVAGSLKSALALGSRCRIIPRRTGSSGSIFRRQCCVKPKRALRNAGRHRQSLHAIT